MRNKTSLLCLSLPLISFPVFAADLNVEISQTLRNVYAVEHDQRTQAEIEFTVTNTGEVDLYDVLIFPKGSHGVPIDPPSERIRIESLAAGETKTVVWSLDTNRGVTTDDFATFGRIEAVNTVTLQIESCSYSAGGKQ